VLALRDARARAEAMTFSGPYLAARIEARRNVALAEYKRARRWFCDPASKLSPEALQERYRIEAFVARAVWSAYADLLREPDWIERRVSGIDLDDLARMAS
jgi:hypothetical protein